MHQYTPIVPLEALTDGQLVELLKTYDAFRDQCPKTVPSLTFYPIRECSDALITEAYRRGILRGVWE